MPTTIRVLVWGPSGLLRDLIERLLTREPDFEVFTAGAADEDLLLIIEANRPHVIAVTAEDRQSIIACSEFLMGEDGGAVLSVVDDGRTLHIWQSPSERKVLEDLSPDQLVATVRAAVR